MSKLDEIRAAVAECNVLENGATLEARQQENAQRLRVFRQLDSYASSIQQQHGIEVNERSRQQNRSSLQ